MIESIKQPPMFVSFIDKYNAKTILLLSEIQVIRETGENHKIWTKPDGAYDISLNQFKKLEAALKDYTINLDD